MDYWYKDAIIYSMDVENFRDSNGDGVGDFQGLKDKLTYIAGLGFNCIWLMPFFPSPNLDDGYDVADYYNVDPRFGTLGDFVDFMTRARELGIRVITDLVINHTSRDHRWFQEARKDPKSPYRNFYTWSTNKPDGADEGMVFPGVQKTTWTYDEVAKAYYFHRFYDHQPDLNLENPLVRREIRKIMGFWLELGVSGFRVDAAPFLLEMKTVDQGGKTDPFAYFREFRDFLSWRRGDAILLAEANVTMDKIEEYFGQGTRMNMIFNFILNQHVFLSLVRQNAQPLMEAIHLAPPIYPSCQWANFLRNHDEIDLGRLTDGQRQEIYAALGPEKSMQLYDRGIRRRMAPMFKNNQARLRMAYSLLLSLPGTPVIYYGDELGMGEDLSLKERLAVRTTMQWTAAPHGGFSDAPQGQLTEPTVSDGPYSYKKLNVEMAQRDPNSLLNLMERTMRVRRETPEFGNGAWSMVETRDEAVFAHCCSHDCGTVVAVHNFSPKAKKVLLDLSDHSPSRLIDMLSDAGYPALKKPPYEFTINGNGYRWLRLEEKLVPDIAGGKKVKQENQKKAATANPKKKEKAKSSRSKTTSRKK